MSIIMKITRHSQKLYVSFMEKVVFWKRNTMPDFAHFGVFVADVVVIFPLPHKITKYRHGKKWTNKQTEQESFYSTHLPYWSVLH